MELLFYVILIVVIVLKLVFWIFYFYARNRRRNQLLQLRTGVEQAPIDGTRRYEEDPAIPQPAYMITQYPFGPDAPATFLVPPVYAVEDPIKTDQPPPPYSVTIDTVVSEETEPFNDSDTLRLVDNQEN